MFGRRKILCDELNITERNVKVLTDALVTHNQNRIEIDRLYGYYRGKQPILNRTKQIRPEICNRVVETERTDCFFQGWLLVWRADTVC